LSGILDRPKALSSVSRSVDVKISAQRLQKCVLTETSELSSARKYSPDPAGAFPFSRRQLDPERALE
jgi:hypothetical protein